MRLLEKSPNERYASASVVKDRLEAALRAETREAETAIVEAALVETGFLPRRTSSAGAARHRGEPPKRARPRALGTSRILLGFAAITAVFVLGAVAIEGTSARPREPRGGAERGGLELVPKMPGGLRVVATPWAFVRVDGQLVETTPFARTIPLGAGRHWVTLSHPEAQTIERGVDIVIGETTTLDVSMNLVVEDAGKDAR